MALGDEEHRVRTWEKRTDQDAGRELTRSNTQHVRAIWGDAQTTLYAMVGDGPERARTALRKVKERLWERM